MSNQQGGTRGAPGNETPPPSGEMCTKQCPLAPKMPTEEVDNKLAHITIEEWATFNIAGDFKYTTVFER